MCKFGQCIADLDDEPELIIEPVLEGAGSEDIELGTGSRRSKDLKISRSDLGAVEMKI